MGAVEQHEAGARDGKAGSRLRSRLSRVAIAALPTALAAGSVVSGFGITGTASAGASTIPAGQPTGTPTIFTDASCAQEYIVPSGVYEIQVDAIGQAGAAGQDGPQNGSHSSNVGTTTAAAYGGAGGEGSEVVSNIAVTPGQELWIGVGDGDGMTGGEGGYGGNFEANNGWGIFNPAMGGRGGAASYVSGAAPSSGDGCIPNDPLVVAGGGGGGGGAGQWWQPECLFTDVNAAVQQMAPWLQSALDIPNVDYCDNNGGAGGTASYAAQSGTGSFTNDDGGGAGTAGTSSGAGTGGSGGSGSWLEQKVKSCTPGDPGFNGGQDPANFGYGSANDGGWGGTAAQDPGPFGPCPLTEDEAKEGIESEGGYAYSTSGGGGGGGGGYYPGGGGGGGDDDYGSGGGGGVGGSYVAGGAANPTPSTSPESVSITPVTASPSFTTSNSATCYVGQYCHFDISANGMPAPQIGWDSSMPYDMEASADFENGGSLVDFFWIPQPADVGNYAIDLTADNDVGTSPATQTFSLDVTYGTLDTLSADHPDSQFLVAGTSGEQLGASGTYSTGYLRDLTDVANWTSSNPSAATISAHGYFQAVGAGQTTLTASYGGRTQSFTVTTTLGYAQSLAITPTAYAGDAIELGASTQFTATATYLDSTANVSSSVTWQSSDTSVLTVSPTGLVTAVGPGEAYISAEINYGAGQVINAPSQFAYVLLDHPSSISITPSSPTAAAGSPLSFTATGTYGSGSNTYTANITDDVTWGSSSPAVIASPEFGSTSVSQTAGSDTVTITAQSMSGNVTGSTTVTTEKGAPSSITVTPLPAANPTVGLGSTLQLAVTGTWADGSTAPITGNISWASNDPSVVAVNQSGVVTGVGTSLSDADIPVAISATYQGYGSANSYTNVVENFDSPSSISVTPGSVTVPRGSNRNFTATATYPGGTSLDITSIADWISGNPNVATVVGSGVIQGSETGGGQSTTVTAYSPSGNTSGSATVSVALGDPTSVSISATNGSLGIGTTEQLTATATYENGTTADVTDQVTWGSDEPSALSVSSSGVATALQPNQSPEVYATLSLPDGTNIPADNTVGISTNDTDPTSITVSTTGSTSLLPGQSQSFTATGHYPGGLTEDLTNLVAWGSSDSTLLESPYDNNLFTSEVTGAGAMVDVLAEDPYNSVVGTLPVTLVPAVSISGPSSDSTVTQADYVSAPFTATGGTGDYVWSVSTGELSLSATTGSSVTLEGSLPTNGSGLTQYTEQTVTATDVNDPSDSQTFQFDLQITPAAQSISFTAPTSGVQNQSVTLSATGGGSGNPVTFSTPPSAICGVYGNTLEYFAPGVCTVYANQAGGTYFSPAEEVVDTIPVSGVQPLTFTQPAPSSVPYGTSSVDVTASDNTPGVVTLTIDPATTNNSCSFGINDSGQGDAAAELDFNNAGTCVIDANQAAAAPYLAAPQVQETITIQQLPQSIGFTSAAPNNALVGGTYAPTVSRGASGTPVQLSIDPATTNSACSVSAGVVSFVHAGSCVVDANEPEPSSSDYASAPQVQQTITVGQATQSFTVTAPATADVGGALSLGSLATPGASGVAVAFEVDSATTNGACTVSGGAVEFKASGACVLDASEAGNSDYLAASSAVVDINVIQLQLVMTSASFSATASQSPGSAFTVEAETPSGTPWVAPSATSVDVSSSSSGGTFSASSGGSPTTVLTIPGGDSSVTGYYADTAAGAPTLTATGAPGGLSFVSGQQTEAITAASVSTLTFVSQPVDQVLGTPQSPPVAVQAEDAFGNPLVGQSVTVGPSVGTVTGGVARTDSSGIATFPSLEFSTAGWNLLAAISGGTAYQLSSTNGFTVYAPVQLSSISPARGAPGGGAVVTLTGSGLSGVTSVDFGSTPAASFQKVSDTEITAVAPSGSGTVPVVVGNDVESSTATAADQFSYRGYLHSATTLTASSTASSPGAAFNLKATVSGSPETEGVPTGSVQFFAGSSSLGTATVSGGGVATLSVDSLPSGTSSITADYSGDDKYMSSGSGAVSHVVRSGSTVTVTPARNFVLGNAKLGITVQVSGSPVLFGTPTGTVTLFDGGKSVGVAGIGTGGSATFSVSLPPGSDDLTATYSGSKYYTSATSTASDVLSVDYTTVSITAPKQASYGASTTISVKVTAPGTVPTGTVLLTDGTPYQAGSDLGTVTLGADGTGSLTTSALDIGSNTVNAYYDGSTYLIGNASQASIAVTEPATLSVSATPDTSNPGTVEIGASVTPDSPVAVSPDGAITYWVGTTEVGNSYVLNGTATPFRATLPVGNDTLTAVYAGDQNFARQTVNAHVSVLVPTALDLRNSAGSSQQGVAVDIQVDLSASGLQASGGVLNFFDGTKLLGSDAVTGSGDYDLSTTALKPGTNALHVAYTGAVPYESSKSQVVDWTVTGVPTVTLTSSAPSVAPGKPMTFTASLSEPGTLPGPYGGTMTFVEAGVGTVATVPVSKTGKASFTTSSLPQGPVTMFADYSGDSLYASGGSNPLTVQIAAASSVTLASSDDPDTDGSGIVLTATVSGTTGGVPTGAVTFNVNGAPLVELALDGNGQAQLTLPPTEYAGGTLDLTATYNGDSELAASTSNTVVQEDSASTSVAIESSSNPAGTDAPVTLNAYVAPAFYFTNVPGGTVTFMDGSTTLGTAPVVSGVATFDDPGLADGTYPITAIYSGGSGYDASTSPEFDQVVSPAPNEPSEVQLAPSENPANLGDIVNVTATVQGTSSGGPAPTGFVIFYANSSEIGAVPLSAAKGGGGNATATFGLATDIYGAGTVDVTASYSGDSAYASSVSGTLYETIQQGLIPTTVQASTVSNQVAVGQPVTINATILPSQVGSAPPSGTVTFTFENTTLGVASVGNNSASLTTSSLPGGSDLIEVSYSGDANYAGSNGFVPVSVGATTSTTLVSSANPSTSGQSVTFTATVTSTGGTPTGVMSFFQGAPKSFTLVSSSAVDGNGQATYTTSALAVGTTTLYAQFSPSPGAAYTLSASPFLTQTVNATASAPASSTSASSSVSAAAQGNVTADVAASSALSERRSRRTALII